MASSKSDAHAVGVVAPEVLEQLVGLSQNEVDVSADPANASAEDVEGILANTPFSIRGLYQQGTAVHTLASFALETHEENKQLRQRIVQLEQGMVTANAQISLLQTEQERLRKIGREPLYDQLHAEVKRQELQDERIDNLKRQVNMLLVANEAMLLNSQTPSAPSAGRVVLAKAPSAHLVQQPHLPVPPRAPPRL